MGIIAKLSAECHTRSLHAGWWETDDDKDILTKLGLVHTEIAEAQECVRENQLKLTVEGEKRKPVGLPSELADILIRLFDLFGRTGLGIELEEREFIYFPEPLTLKHLQMHGHCTCKPCHTCAGTLFNRLTLLHQSTTKIIQTWMEVNILSSFLCAELMRSVLDICSSQGIDIDEAISLKVAYNQTRAHRHGGKTC